jgi:uncharacterized delta-60 repeat protein
MWPSFQHFLRDLFGTHRRNVPRRAHVSSVRPRLEALEDRCLLSAGSLDPTFGNGAGYVTTSTSAYDDGARTVLIQPNGDIVAVGNAGTSSNTYEFGVERYNPNGSLDTSFGSGGVALASFGSQSVVGSSGALYPAGTANAGEIVEEGASSNGQYQVLARFNSNGTLDTTFGTGGEVMTAIPGISSINDGLPDIAPGPNDQVVVTSTGQIVALGVSQNTGQFALVRYNANGSLDTTFGQGGFVITAVPNADLGSCTLLQQPDGSLIVTATSDANGAGSLGLWDLFCFNANGTPNTSFGNQGVVTTAAPGGTSTAALYFNAGPSNDGQIVVVGESGETEYLARYNANGSLDTTFGTGGLVQSPFSFVPWQAAVDANGRIVVTGFNGSGTEVARFNVNGTPDTTFGNGGLMTTTFGTGSKGQAVAIYPNAGASTDGDIVVAGYTGNGTKDNVLVARYLAQANAPYFQITGPSSVTAGTAGSFTLTALNPDGSDDTGYSGTVQITSSDPQAVLSGDITVTGGTATFSATLVTAGSQSLTATDTSNGSIIGSESGITVTPAAASQVVFTQVPSSGTAGQTLGTVQAAIEDAYGNVETADNSDKVALSVNTGPSTQLGGTLTATVQAGIATFSNLLLDTSGSYTLAAQANLSGGGTLGPVVSSGIVVASPVSLSFGSITYNSKTKLYSETVTLTNTTSGTLTGPMSLELTNLPSGVVLTDASGTTNGNPYVRFLASGKTLKKGASTSITLTFTAASASDISFGTEVVVGL